MRILYYRLNVIPIALPASATVATKSRRSRNTSHLKWSHELAKGCMRVSGRPDGAPGALPVARQHPPVEQRIHRMVAFADAGSPLTLDHLPKALRAETELLKRRANRTRNGGIARRPSRSRCRLCRTRNDQVALRSE